MKMFMIVYSQAADYDVITQFKKAGIKHYTKMEQAHGEGDDTEPKLGTHTWPGKNNVLFVAVPTEEIGTVRDVVKHLKENHPRTGVKAFMLPMEESV
ncbi:MAG: PG0541 family transporter-associated protein [Pseudomonadota bacterium]